MKLLYPLALLGTTLANHYEKIPSSQTNQIARFNPTTEKPLNNCATFLKNRPICGENYDPNSSGLLGESLKNLKCGRAYCCKGLSIHSNYQAFCQHIDANANKPPPSKIPGAGKKPCKKGWMTPFKPLFGNAKNLCSASINPEVINALDMKKYFYCYRAWCCPLLNGDKHVCDGISRPSFPEKPYIENRTCKKFIRKYKDTFSVFNSCRVENVKDTAIATIKGAKAVRGFLCAHSRCCRDSPLDTQLECKKIETPDTVSIETGKKLPKFCNDKKTTRFNSIHGSEAGHVCDRDNFDLSSVTEYGPRNFLRCYTNFCCKGWLEAERNTKGCSRKNGKPKKNKN